ncbi:MAG: hypothetical protein E7622_04270 [Ruminococcaceae bacterium]|nr:hypothetical protein [Oscillospiraceae bacterium]
MKSKRLILCLAFVFALMLALAISSYAATITIHSGADSTSPSTEYNGSITLAGNTEADETVTVYFADDGRAWKAGETVSFKENTVLYTIECTKISTAAEWNAATNGNYILVNHLDFNFEIPKADGSGGEGSGTRNNAGGSMELAQGSTTRVFFNGYTIGNGNAMMFSGKDVSISLLGTGKINSYWGGRIFSLSFTANADSTILVGKNIVANSDWTNKVALIGINEYKATSKLDIHFYGSFTKGHFISQNQTPTTGSYNVYLHEGCDLNLPNSNDGGRFIATATTPIANVFIDGGTYTFPRENLFADNAEFSRFQMNITGGTFNFSYESTMTFFKNSIDQESKAQDLNATSFKVVCKECDYIKTLGDDFVNLATDFTINNYCPNCKSVGTSTSVEKVFTTKGYSVSQSGTAIDGGYGVNQKSLALYESVVGEVKYGIVIANADMFGGKSFFDENNKVNTEWAVQIEIDGQYSIFSCSIDFGTTSNSSLNLVICAYAVDSTGASFIQHSTGDAVASSKIAGGAFKSITLDMIATEPAILSTGKND